MRRALSLLLAGLAIAAAPAAAAKPATGEARLARAIEGRIAGEPTDCIDLRDIRSSRIIADTAIVYEGPGNVLWVNRPRSGASSLDSWDVLVTNTHSSRLCSIDVVRLYDTAARMQTGFVFLGDFVPYRKPRPAR
jgi:hypothetical protein